MRNSNALSAKATERLNVILQKNRRYQRQTTVHNPYRPLLLFPQAPHPQLLASVIVPAKDEAHHICTTLDALRLQQDENGNQLPYPLFEVLLLANNCADDTYEVALGYQQKHPQFLLHIAVIELDKERAHIGTVRRMLMDEAFRRHVQNGHDGIILSTDADTEVDAQWIAHTLREMSSGCDAVGGRILARNVANDCKLYYLQDITYRCLSARLEALVDPLHDDPNNCHFQCFGASLAVRCSAYHRAGRLPVIPFLEDEAFSRALLRVDARIKRSQKVKVYTSSRLTGRVAAGLSVHLKHLGDLKKENIVPHVESAKTLMEKWRMRQQLRSCWQARKMRNPLNRHITSLAVNIGVSPKWLQKEMDLSVYFGALWEKVEQQLYSGAWRQQQQLISIDKAIGELRGCLKY